MHEFKTKLEPFGRGWVSCESDNLEKKSACGLLQWAKETNNLKIDADLGLCYSFMDGATGVLNYGMTYCSEGALDSLIKENPDDAEDLTVIKEEMIARLEHQRLWDHFTVEQKKHLDEGDLWGGTWCGHSNPKYGDFAVYGTNAYRRKIDEARRSNPGHDDFYDAMMISLDAIDVIGKRFGDLAKKMLAEDDLTDTQRVKVDRIAVTFDHAPAEPCRDFCEGLAMFSMIFTLDGVAPDSPGYFDQYMYDLWKVTDAGVRREYLENLWEFFHNTRSWNLTVAGSDEDWNDRSNDLTYEILDVTAKKNYNTPNLTLRVHRNTPEKIREAAYKCLAAGCGLPALYNDEAVCPALERIGIPPCDSHKYVMNGCNQIDIMGKSHMGLEDGEISFGKALEYTLWSGESQTTGTHLGLYTGDPCEFKTFDEFLEAFLRQLDYMTDLATDMSNRSQAVYAGSARNPLRSLLIEGCIEKAKDYKEGGPVYGHGQILAEAIADTIDSLAVIKKYVFEDKAFPMEDLLPALKADFEGYDDIYQTVTHTEFKFGNDNDYVDSIAKTIVDHWTSYLLTIPTFRGGVFSAGCSPLDRIADYGKNLGTLPNGHKKGQPIIADSIGAVPGGDTNGPTALINSCVKYDQTLPASGFILNLKFDKSVFCTEQGRKTFEAVCRSYFERKGQQLQITVVSRDELIDAQKNPDAHRDLIVRIGGYSAYFCNLSKANQDNVIARTAH